MKRLSPGDRILYYSPRTEMRTGQPLQAFTAIGEVLAGDPYQVKQSERFQPFRRDVRYFDAREAPIRPLLPDLSFVQGSASWGQVMSRHISHRRGRLQNHRRRNARRRSSRSASRVRRLSCGSLRSYAPHLFPHLGHCGIIGQRYECEAGTGAHDVTESWK